MQRQGTERFGRASFSPPWLRHARNPALTETVEVFFDTLLTWTGEGARHSAFSFQGPGRLRMACMMSCLRQDCKQRAPLWAEDGASAGYRMQRILGLAGAGIRPPGPPVPQPGRASFYVRTLVYLRGMSCSSQESHAPKGTERCVPPCHITRNKREQG